VSLLVVRVANPDEADVASDWLWSLGAQAIEERADEPVSLIAGFTSSEAALAVRDVVGERWPTRFEVPPDEAEWRDVWLEHLEPVTVDRFVIHPPWRPAPSDGAHQSLSIDPGRAFGSGHHPTTRLAIRLMTNTVEPGHRVLDVGCGTGVLSIVAGALGAGSVEGIDLNLDIAELARTNAEANGLPASTVNFSDRPLSTFTDDAVGSNSDWDLVVANMTRANTSPLMADLVRLASHHLILSGLLDSQAEEVNASITDSSDLLLVSSVSAEGWTALRFDRR